MNHFSEIMQIPLCWVGPLKIINSQMEIELKVPMATYEVPLWHSVRRGALVTKLAGGIESCIESEVMTRSFLLEAPSASLAIKQKREIEKEEKKFRKVVRRTSKYAEFISISGEIVANLIYFRVVIDSKKAAGHNMVTKATHEIIRSIIMEYKDLKYISISANLCTDKKTSAINGILGRGKRVIAQIIIPYKLCVDHLHTTPAKIVDLHIKKNLLGSILAGSVRSANAHFANMLLAFYLACGQDGANVVEGSQGIVHCELRGDDLYFSVTIPNIIVGTVGISKELPSVKENLSKLGCLECDVNGAQRLALIAGGIVLCGELSLLAALTNPHELTQSHEILERGTHPRSLQEKYESKDWYR